MLPESVREPSTTDRGDKSRQERRDHNYLVIRREIRVALEGKQETALFLREREGAYRRHGQQQILGPGGAAGGRPLSEELALGSCVRLRVLALRRADRQAAAVIAGEERAVVSVADRAHRQVLAVASRPQQQRRVREDRLADSDVSRGEHSTTAQGGAVDGPRARLVLRKVVLPQVGPEQLFRLSRLHPADAMLGDCDARSTVLTRTDLSLLTGRDFCIVSTRHRANLRPLNYGEQENAAS